MKMRGLLITAVLALLAVPAFAGATTQLTATGVRITDHPAFVRVAIYFNGTVSANQATAGFLTSSSAAVRIDHPGVTTSTRGGSGDGVRVAVQPATQGLGVWMSYAPHRFKYISYVVVSGNRLAIDLWKSAPPPPGSAFIHGRNCLTISHWAQDSAGVVSAAGTVHNVFENTFRVVVRGPHGAVLGRRVVTQSSPWSTRVKYTAASQFTGTLEVAAVSPKDGSLACLYEVRAFLDAS